VVASDFGRRNVVAAAPDLHLLLAVLGRGLGLVEALQGAVVALVEAPALVHRNPGLIELGEHHLLSVDRALEHRGVGDVELIALVAQQLAGGDGLVAARFGDVDVDPAGEAVFEVPLALAMTQQNEFAGAHRHRSSCWSLG
jgi:hypothetical protein